MKNPGPVYILFVEVAKLPQGERKAALIPRLELLWDKAMARTYISKGEEHANPDLTVALKVVEAADHILGEAAASSTGKFAALRRFDSAPKKVAG